MEKLLRLPPRCCWFVWPTQRDFQLHLKLHEQLKRSPAKIFSFIPEKQTTKVQYFTFLRCKLSAPTVTWFNHRSSATQSGGLFVWGGGFLTVCFLEPFSGLCFDFYTFFPPPTAAAGAQSWDMEADIVECDKLEESEDTDTFQGTGPIPNRFLSSFIHLFIYFFGERFYSAAVLLRFQALEAFVCCRCFDAQQHVVTPADRGRRPVSLWPPHLHPESLHFTNR